MSVDIDRIKQDIKERLDNEEIRVNNLNDFSIKNFSAWRDYLHSYYTVIFLLIGATGALNADKVYSNYWVKLGILIALAGVFIGYVLVNIYFYLERKWKVGDYILHDLSERFPDRHPQAKVDNIRTSLLLHLKDELKMSEKAKGDTKDKDMRNFIKMDIRIIKQDIFGLRLVGGQFGVIQAIWCGGVIASLTLSMLGVIVLFINLK